MLSKKQRHARDYGWRHQQLREAWKRKVAAGGETCARCGQEILPGEPVDLDHRDDRQGYLGPSHRACNRSHGAGLRVNRHSRLW
jgi:hypothetical protein